MPLTRPHSPFRSQPVHRARPRKGPADARAAGLTVDDTAPKVKGQRLRIRLAASAQKSALKVLRTTATE